MTVVDERALMFENGIKNFSHLGFGYLTIIVKFYQKSPKIKEKIDIIENSVQNRRGKMKGRGGSVQIIVH